MAIYQRDKDMLPDSEFVPGQIAYLVEGNHCRLLDSRRTPGVVEAYFEDSAMFRWRILNFEDKGKFWDVPAEDVVRYQFSKDTKTLNTNAVQAIETSVNEYQKLMTVDVTEESKKKTEAEISATKQSIIDWLSNNSTFFKIKEQLDFESRTGSESLTQDLVAYMKSVGLEDVEERTADIIVINPNSGEWIKGMAIVLAEMGLVPYCDKIPRTPDIFDGLGSRENRRWYLIHRLAFVRAYFQLLGIDRLVLYRGMSTDREWGVRSSSRTFVSFTFSLKLARAHCSFDRESPPQHSYLIKRAFPVETLFMTYLETAAMNRQYLEAEALVLYRKEDSVFW